MYDTLKAKVRRILQSEETWVICCSLVFGAAFCLIKLGSDDPLNISAFTAGNLVNWARRVIAQYATHSSRQLVNFIVLLVLNGGRLAWVLYMALSMYIMLKAMIALFADENKHNVVIYIISTLFMFPFSILTSAGWICTATTYFGPQACAMMALVPIKKIFKNEIITWRAFFFYCICLIYAANVEQICAALFAFYLIAAIYFLAVKKNNLQIWILWSLTIVSLIYTLTCPGNQNRSISEIRHWFPTYGMLNVIDKADIGLSTTLKWIFANGNLFVIIMCIMLTFLVWKKYTEPLFRAVSLVPTCLTLVLGPFKDFFFVLFPNLSYAAQDVNYYGTFNAATLRIDSGIIQFFLYLITAICICVEIILINDTIADFIVDISLIAVGVATRCVMGFSPTVYASSFRTYTNLIVCLMAASIHIYSVNCHLIGQRLTRALNYILCFLIMLNFINLAFTVTTVFY